MLLWAFPWQLWIQLESALTFGVGASSTSTTLSRLEPDDLGLACHAFA